MMIHSLPIFYFFLLANVDTLFPHFKFLLEQMPSSFCFVFFLHNDIRNPGEQHLLKVFDAVPAKGIKELTNKIMLGLL